MKRKKILSRNFLIVIAILIILTVIGVIKFQAEFFDVFGLLSFSFLIFVGGWMLYTDTETPDWVGMVLLGMGILGIIVDGGIIIKFIIAA